MTSKEGPTAKVESSDLSTLQAFVEKNPSIEFVRLQWVDYTAVVRTRIVTIRQAKRLAGEGKSVNVASPFNSFLLVDGSFHQVNAGAKDYLVPDWSTIVACAYQPCHAAVMCFIEEQGRGFDFCARSLLKKMEREISEKHHLTFKIGVEIEFYLMQSAESGSPVNDVMAYCATASLRTPYLAVLEDSVRAIERAGIHLWTIHSELRPGLFEISTDPMAPLQAADALVYIHEAIKASAVKHGFHATMHPKPFDKTHGVGQHMHISLSAEEKADSFMAGVLNSVPAISAISMPNYDSWLRRDFAGGEWVGWDVENRTSSVRKIEQSHCEYRFIDGTANTYLTLAAILGVGTAAWERGTALTVKPMSQWPAPLNEQNRKEAGVEKRAPRDLRDALEQLRKDEDVKNALGDEVCERFVTYKEHEEEMLRELTLAERRKMVIQLF